MPSASETPLFTAHAVVQGLASDSALLLSLVTTVERMATPEQKAAFVRHFVSLLLLCRDDGVFAGSELLGELFLLDLDDAMWRQHDSSVFLRRSSTIVSSLLDQLARETFASPEGNLLPHLISATRVLSAGDDASTMSIATPMGVSPGAWSHPSEDGPLASSAPPDGANVYDRFSTSELAGLATAEQQFYTDLGESPFLINSLRSNGGGTGMEGSRPPLHLSDDPAPLPRSVPAFGVSKNNGNGSSTGNSGWRDSFRLTRDTDGSNNGLGSRPSTRLAFTGIQIREAVDFFSEASTWSDPRGGYNAECALGVVDVRAEAVLTLAFQVLDVVSKHISDCPLVLRRAFWLWLRAASGRSGPVESAEVSPALRANSKENGLAAPPLALPGASSPSPAGGAAAAASAPPSPVSFEFVGMATIVVVHMLTPLLLSVPSFVLPVEEDEDSEAYVTTTRRFRFLAKVLQKAAYGALFDERHEPELAPLNRGMRELHRRWVACFSALADYRNGSSMNWCCPLPCPLRGLATVASTTTGDDEQAVLQRYFEFLDGFLVPYLQTTVLLRRFTEAIHLPQWLRCTYFAARFARGQMGCINDRDDAATAVKRPPRIAAARHVPAWSAASSCAENGESDEVKLRRLSSAVAHVMATLALEDDTPPAAASEPFTPVVSAFMANFIFFLGTNSAKVTTLVVYEDLLRRYWAQFPQETSPTSRGPCVSAERAEAAAVLTFYIYLAVQHNVVSPRFQLVLIPSVSAALRTTTKTEQQQQQQQEQVSSDSFAFSTRDTLQWLWEVLETIPVSYRQHCTCIWTATVAQERGGLVPEQQAAFAVATAVGAHMPKVRICPSFSQLMSALMKGLSSYVPLSADDYHWMVSEQQQQQQQKAGAVLQGTPYDADGATHADPSAASATGFASASAATSPVAACKPSDARDSLASVAPVSSSATLRSLRQRWRRPLAVSESLRASGILPLHSTRGLFEVLCTVTCRRLWTDGTLQPIVGVNTLEVLVQPLSSIVQLYSIAADVAATLLVAVDATPPPRWLRDLQFHHGCVTVHVEPERGSPLRASPSLSPTSAAAAAGGVSATTVEQVHWPQSAWFYPSSESSADVADADAAALTTQWESLMQHVLFFSSEFDASISEYDNNSDMAEQILSTRWGLSGTVSAATSPTEALTGGSARSGGAKAAAEPPSALHAVPSLRHLSIESLWRLFLFNVRQTCHIMRRMTPRECPFCRMEGAIADVLRGSSSGSGVRKRPTVAVRPGLEDAHTSLSERVAQAAADALRSCYPSEVTIVRLIVSVAAYMRNVHTVLGKLRDRGVAVPPAVSSASYKAVVRSGTAQLLYGAATLTPAQERLVDLLCFDGDVLTQKAYLPYYDNCTWHPYGRLLYDC